jgi:hypothetical protein
MRLSGLAATATPGHFARSSTGCSTSPAPCLKIELCSTLHSGRRKRQLRDSHARCAGQELSLFVSADRRGLVANKGRAADPVKADSRRRRWRSQPLQGPAPPGPHSAANSTRNAIQTADKIWRATRKKYLQKRGESAPTAYCRRPARADAVKAGRFFSGHPSGPRPLQQSSTTAGLMGRGRLHSCCYLSVSRVSAHYITPITDVAFWQALLRSPWRVR